MKTSSVAAGGTVIILSKRWTRKGGRFVLPTPEGDNIFEFDDSSERADQLCNAVRLTQNLLDANRGGHKPAKPAQ